MNKVWKRVLVALVVMNLLAILPARTFAEVEAQNIIRFGCCANRPGLALCGRPCRQFFFHKFT